MRIVDLTHRYLVNFQSIKQPGKHSLEQTNKGGKMMEVLISLGILVAWLVLQVWVLPYFGVKT